MREAPPASDLGVRLNPVHVLFSMSNDDTAAMASAIAEPLGDIAVAFLLIVKALRRQPGFNDDVFVCEIKALLEGDDLSKTRRDILSSLL